MPESRLQELLNVIESKGLADVSISREKEKLAWGVPVPGDESQVMYVWFDALTNYLTPSCRINEAGDIVPADLWPAEIHCIGKDISRFHALLWPGMLLSAGLPLPKELLVHGFLSSGGQKMSKSLGNVVDPFAVIERFGSDAARWYLLKEVSTTADADFTEERVLQVYMADLANDFGNLVSRVLTMAHKYCAGEVPVASKQLPGWLPAEEAIKEYRAKVEDRAIHLGLAAIHRLLVACNKQIDERKPWVLAKDSSLKSELDQLLYELLEAVRLVSYLLQAALPTSSQAVLSQVFPFLTDQAEEWGGLEAGNTLGQGPIILFPRIENHD